MSVPRNTEQPSERRGTRRFPMVLDIRYRILAAKGDTQLGTGKSVDISSSGVLFLSQTPLSPEKRIELSISWPVQLDGRCPLKLITRGRIIRCKGAHVAVELEKCEFRLQGSKKPLTPPGG